ncbi:MAG: TRAP transporter small permease [Rhodospirillales bacterium]|nr:TRAP transporter small permease [Rhodospirillales bacterium]
MPQLETSTLIWISCLVTGAVLWMIFIAPRLLPMLEMTIHQTADDEIRKITIVDKITLYMSSILMFVVAFIMFIMFYEVVMRYLFNSPTLWVEEMSRWLGGVIFLLAGLYAMQQRAHIRVVIVYDMVSRPVQRIFDLIATACVVFFCYAAATGYAKNALTKFTTWELYGSAWNPPIPATMKPLIVIACTWMAIQAINNLIMDWSKPKELHDPADDLK